MGAGSATGVKGPEAGLIELLETTVRKDIEINMPESLINSIDNMELRALVKAMVEFSSKTLLLSRRVGSLYEREVKEGNRTKVEELQEKVDKHDEEKEAWKKKEEEWELERKRLATWRVRCLDSKEKLKGRIVELEADYDDMKEKHDGLEDEKESSSEGNEEKEAADANVGGDEVVAEEVEQKVISREDLSVGEKEVVDTLMQFSDKMPTKGLVRVYNSVHPIIDIEGHMAQLGKKNLTLFQALRKEKAVKAKAAGNTAVPNLQDSLVDVHVHGGTKRKAELPVRAGKGKDVKRVRVAVMGAGSATGVKGPEAGLIELLETTQDLTA
ncbi:hypothetical protein DEO72_LG1g2861 [Vigna unguiculata]|uniref:Uncharacterized protein n=1 Tax=Vigna unguiculata TaxID=3917 RepID=A0A4D6KNU9_VIGUN|nr:hypothetical protein DEO72_LG1g2861 [Vigna unguiculata]